MIFNAVKEGSLKFYVWNPSGLEGALKRIYNLNQDEKLFNKGLIGQCRKKLVEVHNSDEYFNIIREQFFLMKPRIYNGVRGSSQW